jgi:hypothetical protein
MNFTFIFCFCKFVSLLSQHKDIISLKILKFALFVSAFFMGLLVQVSSQHVDNELTLLCIKLISIAGKTLLARAVASQLDANFLKVVSSAIVDKYIGESARLIREMFNYARDHQPCIIFMVVT